ncbi:hypothetical protein BH10PSE2_BH10PSE2_01680 [soil metagenome]
MVKFLIAATVALVVQSAPPPARPAPLRPDSVRPVLTSYDDMVRCAGLTQAASEMEGGESADGKALFDAALYWALTASQAAQASGKPGEASDADQTRARINAVRQLNAHDADARSDLQRCRTQTPDLG